MRDEQLRCYAWVHFAAARLSHGDSLQVASNDADAMLKKFEATFPDREPDWARPNPQVEGPRKDT